MKCLVCDSPIRIDSLKQLFSIEPLRLCSRCSVNLVPSVEAGILYQRNEWVVAVIDKLNQGDLVLLELLKNKLQREMQRKGWQNYQIEVAKPDQEMPYPWLEILVEQLKKNMKTESSVLSTDALVIMVEKEKNTKNQIGILEKI